MIVLNRSDWSAWLEGIDNEAELLRSLPAGRYRSSRFDSSLAGDPASATRTRGPMPPEYTLNAEVSAAMQ